MIEEISKDKEVDINLKTKEITISSSFGSQCMVLTFEEFETIINLYGNLTGVHFE